MTDSKMGDRNPFRSAGAGSAVTNADACIIQASLGDLPNALVGELNEGKTHR